MTLKEAIVKRVAAATVLLAGLVHLDCAPAAPAAGSVRVDGNLVPGAWSTIDNTIELIEIRDGTGGSVPRLAYGIKRFGVCVVAPGPVPAFDALFRTSASAPRFRVAVEDGSVFVNCLLTGQKAEGKGRERRFSYCHRCEGLTAP